jgi:hypothetical protein
MKQLLKKDSDDNAIQNGYYYTAYLTNDDYD